MSPSFVLNRLPTVFSDHKTRTRPVVSEIEHLCASLVLSVSVFSGGLPVDIGILQMSVAVCMQADKRWQMADWRVRPLSDEALLYARMDTHFLLYMYDRIKVCLVAPADRTEQPQVRRLALCV